VCAGSNAAKAANRNALIQHRYKMWSRYHKTMQAYGRYGINKIQGKVEQYNINQGLFRSWSKAQGMLNSVKNKVLKANTQGWVQQMSESKYFGALASGLQGASIARIGILEAGKLGRFYASNINKYYKAREKTKEGMQYAKLVAGTKLDQSFAARTFAPTPDIQMAAPAMQSTSIFNDVLQGVGSIVGIASGMGWVGASDRRLKTDIKKLGESIEGHNIYKYKYLDQPEEYIGAMADEVFKKKPSAVFIMDNGYMGVDYSQIDVEFREVVPNASRI